MRCAGERTSRLSCAGCDRPGTAAERAQALEPEECLGDASHLRLLPSAPDSEKCGSAGSGESQKVRGRGKAEKCSAPWEPVERGITGGRKCRAAVGDSKRRQPCSRKERGESAQC